MDDLTAPGFGERLREAFQGASNSEIAELLGVGKSAVTNYVNDRPPKSRVLSKIPELTGVSLHWLLTGKGPKHTEEGVSEATMPARRGAMRISLPDDLLERVQAEANLEGRSVEEEIVRLVAEAVEQRALTSRKIEEAIRRETPERLTKLLLAANEKRRR